MDMLTGYGSDSGDENKSNDEQIKEEISTYEPVKLSSSLALKVCSAPEVVSTVSFSFLASIKKKFVFFT